MCKIALWSDRCERRHKQLHLIELEIRLKSLSWDGHQIMAFTFYWTSFYGEVSDQTASEYRRLKCITNTVLLHERSWILPLMKSMSSELDFVSQLSRHVIHLWRHKRSIVTPPVERRERVRHEINGRELLCFIVTYGFNIYCCGELFISPLECYFDFYFRRCFGSGEINIKSTPSWPHTTVGHSRASIHQYDAVLRV